MALEKWEYHHGDVALIGQISLPDGNGKHPAVMAMHDARGMGAVPQRRIQELSALGYVGFAADMYGGGENLGTMGGGAHMFALHNDPAKFRARLMACLDALRAHPRVDPARIAVIGYCFGGQCALELARIGADAGADVQLAVSFHGLLTTANPAVAGAVKAHVAVFNGGQDPYVPAEHIAGFEAEMRAAGVSWQATLFNEAAHAFTDPDADMMGELAGIAYDEMADRQSWASTLILLEKYLR